MQITNNQETISPTTQLLRGAGKKTSIINNRLLKCLVIGVWLFLGFSFLGFGYSANAATEFISWIDPGSGPGAGFTNLNTWNTAVACDLTAATTKVFSFNAITASGTIPNGSAVTGQTSGATATLVHQASSTDSNQILLKTIAGGSFQSGEQVYLTSTGASSTFAYITDSGDSAIAVAKCRSTNGAADGTAVNVTGWVTSATNYIKIWTDPDDPYGRHQGKWDDNRYHLEFGDNESLIINKSYVQVIGLQINNTTLLDGNANYSFSIGDFVGIELDSLILKGPLNGTGIRIDGASLLTEVQISNSLIYNLGEYGYLSEGVYADYANSVSIYNTVIFGFDDAIERDTGIINVYNSAVFGNNDDFDGTINVYNSASDDGNGSGAVIPSEWSDQFVDYLNGDFHLKEGSSLIDSGTSTGYLLPATSYDIDGTARGAAYDIGADEVPVDFTSIICQNTSAGGGCANLDYQSLATWEDKVEADLTASTTRVFSGSITGTLAENATVNLCNGATDLNIDGVVVATTSDQILIDGITGTSTPLSAGTSWVWNDDACGATSNYWTVSGSGDALGASPIAVAEIDGAWTATDTLAATLDIDGWSTDNDNYINIYTTDDARHAGKWSEAKYRLARTNGTVVLNQENYIWIDGLQLSLINTTSGSSRTAIYSSHGSENGADVRISNNIIRGQLSGSANSGTGITSAADIENNNEYTKVWNNIIYDFYINNIGSGISMYNGNAYVYNNTIYNSYTGIFTSSPIENNTTVLANNIVQCNAASSTFTDYMYMSNIDIKIDNIASDSSSPNNEFDNTIINFADLANDDFHLADTDTAAINTGTDLSSTSTLNFLVDIDGGARDPDGLGWDIGADEVAAKIYRSVGNTSAALSTGGSTVTISSTTRLATFSAGQPDNVGVGDVIQFGNAGAYDLAFISGRISSTIYSVQAWDGGAPSATTSAAMNIYRAYRELDDWEDNTTADVNATINSTQLAKVVVGSDLVASNTIMMAACYAASTADDSTTVVSGWTTSPRNYVNIYTPYKSTEVGASQRHQGKWDTSYYYIEKTPNGSNQHGIYILNDKYVRIDGLQIHNIDTGYSSVSGIATAGHIITDNLIYISNNIIKGTDSTALEYGIEMGSNTNTYMFNNIIYDYSITDSRGIFVNGASQYIFNNTVYNCYQGYYSGANTAVAVNNIAADCENYGFRSAGWISGSGFNLSTDGSADDDADMANATMNAAVQFIDETNDDFRLSPDDTVAKNAGTSTISTNLNQSLQISLSTDIQGHKRGTYDIGADEASEYYISRIRTGDKPDSDYTTLSGWEAANDCDLTAWNTLVFTYSAASGTIPDGSNVIGATSGATGTLMHMTTASGTKQILITDITPSASSGQGFESGELIYISTSTANYANAQLADIGSPAIAVAECYNDWPTGLNNSVTVGGWGTSATNYVKIYAPDDQSHNGIPGAGFYMFYNNNVITLNNSYTVINGIDIRDTSTSGNSYDGMRISSQYNTINSVLATTNGTVYSAAFKIVQLNNYFINCVAYNSLNGYSISYGYGGGNKFLNSSAINNSSNGIWWDFFHWSSTGKIVLKNFFAYNNGTDFTSYCSNSDYVNASHNASKDSSALGTNSITGITSDCFVDYTNNDFRLMPENCPLVDAGSDLSTEIYPGGTSPACAGMTNGSCDIVGTTRPTNLTWDIGAFEAPQILYRSVGNDTNNLIPSGTKVTVTATNTDNAVFSSGLPANIGVGDILQIGTSTYQMLVIHGRTSSSTYSVRLGNGTVPTAAYATSSAPVAVYRAHRYLDDWEDQLTADVNAGIHADIRGSVLVGQDLVASNTAMFVPCYASTSADSLRIVIDGWTTGTSSYIKIYTPVEAEEVGITQRHNGVWDDEVFKFVNNGLPDQSFVFTNYESYVKFEGLQIQSNEGGFGITASSGKIYIDKILIKDLDYSARIIYLYTANEAETIVRNLLSYNGSIGIYGKSADRSQLKIYNSTIIRNNSDTINSSAGVNYALAQNVAALNFGGEGSWPNFVNMHASSSHLVCNDNGYSTECSVYPNSIDTTEDLTALFTDPDNYDYSIRNIYSDLYDNGTTITIVTDDITGTARPRFDAYDVGAFEFSGEKPKFRIQPGLGGMRFQGHFEFK